MSRKYELLCQIFYYLYFILKWLFNLQVILAIGGESSGMALGSVECFTLGYEGWKCIVPTSVQESEPCEDTRVIPTMHHPRFYAAVTAKDYEVFVIG